MKFLQKLNNIRALEFAFSAVLILSGSIFLYGPNLDAVHIAVLPCVVFYFLIFRKNPLHYFRRYHLTYFGILAIAVAAYMVSLGRLIPEIRVRWSELPIAMLFLFSIHIVVWLIDRVVNTVLSSFFGLKSNSRSPYRIFIPKTILRIFIVAAVVCPYLLAVFMVHWIKFDDDIDPQKEFGIDFEQVRFEAADSTELGGWFIPSVNFASESTLIIAPGRGTTKASFITHALIFSNSGYNVLLFDFRGQGSSDGHTSSFGVLEARDVIGAVDFLKDKFPKFSYYVFALGISEGAQAVINAAAQDERIRAVVIDSACEYPDLLPEEKDSRPFWFVNYYLRKTKLLFASVILGHNLFGLTEAERQIAQISPRPVLIFHGSQDKIADPVQAKRLYWLAKEPKQLCMVPEAGHAQVLLYTRESYVNEASKAFTFAMLE